jgi:23S rRNA (guanine745-N1)-methyltransferase
VPALDDALHLLRCPHCAAPLARADGAVACSAGHSFDVARQGYLNLIAGAPAHAGDTAEMVSARERFLAEGHLDPLAEQLGELVARAVGQEAAWVVDLGAGPGWQLARALDRLPGASGLALDVSKPALRRAARAHPRIAAIGCDAWRPLPLRDGVAAAVLNMFAPRNGPELARILAPAGIAVVVTPGPAHMAELAGPLGLLGIDERKDQRLAAELAPALAVTDRRELEWRMRLDRAAARDAAAMGPSAFHVSPAELDERVAALPDRLDVTAAVTITIATAG